MIIQSKTSNNRIRTIGRLSDGSDREEVIETIWTISIVDNFRTYQLYFTQGTEPTEVEIQSKYQSGEYVDVTTDKDIISQLQIQTSELKEQNLVLMDALATVFETLMTMQGGT